jgi:hypothetical protein
MKKIKSIIILFMLISVPLLIFSQPDPRLNGNGTGVGNTPVGSPIGSPIDGGLGVLLALGLGYAARNIYRIRKKA